MCHSIRDMEKLNTKTIDRSLKNKKSKGNNRLEIDIHSRL